jgi:hypothetical protein
MKSRGMKWAGHYSTHVSDEKSIQNFIRLKQRDHLGDLGVDGRIILKYNTSVWTGCMWLRIGTSGWLL